jgi:DNA-binding response OmpR family regulator
LRRGLEADGYRVRLESDGAAAVEAFREELPDLTILDLNMPVKDGEQVLSDVRTMDADLPVLILTGRQEVDTRVRCLDRGADDLMVKPFSLSELRARVRALLRRKRATGLYLRAGDLEVSRLDHSVTRCGHAIELTNKEFALLEHLLLNRGHCVSRVELLDSVWKMEPAQTTNIVDVYVNYLRRKLHDPAPGKLIRTVRGQGYLVPTGGSALNFSISRTGLDRSLPRALGVDAAGAAPMVSGKCIDAGVGISPSMRTVSNRRSPPRDGCWRKQRTHLYSSNMPRCSWACLWCWHSAFGRH